MRGALLLKSAAVVASVHCSQWERLDRPVWRAESFAKVEVVNDDSDYDEYMLLWRVDVTEKYAPSLFWMLEYECFHAMDGGIWP
jgi:hypothetical protein